MLSHLPGNSQKVRGNLEGGKILAIKRTTKKDCINPALDTRVFPDLKIGHYWSRDGHIFGDRIACSLYTYKGQGYCWQRKKIELPFLLVSDEKAKQITFLGQINRILIDFSIKVVLWTFNVLAVLVTLPSDSINACLISFFSNSASLSLRDLSLSADLSKSASCVF